MLMNRTPEQIAKTLANIAERAKTLFTTGGYAYDHVPGSGLFFVKTPLYIRSRARLGKLYLVWAGEKVGYSCQCDGFKYTKTCKHVQACILELEAFAADDAQAAEYDRMQGSAEHAEYGVDPHAEF